MMTMVYMINMGWLFLFLTILISSLVEG